MHACTMPRSVVRATVQDAVGYVPIADHAIDLAPNRPYVPGTTAHPALKATTAATSVKCFIYFLICIVF